MDKKQKKRLDVLRKKLDKYNKLLGFAKQQNDDPEEIPNLEAEIQKIKDEIESIKSK